MNYYSLHLKLGMPQRCSHAGCCDVIPAIPGCLHDRVTISPLPSENTRLLKCDLLFLQLFDWSRRRFLA
jgi:hypothetical protein